MSYPSALPYSLGIDFGTSGARVAVVDPERRVQFQSNTAYPGGYANAADGWQAALLKLLGQIPLHLKQSLSTITCDGTSATVLLCNRAGEPLTEPLMYNDARGKSVLASLVPYLPADHPALSATSSLAKLLWWQQTLPSSIWNQAAYLLHQADWILFLLHGICGISDYHNSLKLGYDTQRLDYPHELKGLSAFDLMPDVREPGSQVAVIRPELAAEFGISPECTICAGTTDSNAAFLASGACQPGDGLTVLGSTMVIKLLSTSPITHSRYGIYSHRLGDRWIVGGASNTGGAVLKKYFSEERLITLSQSIDLTTPSRLNYYPLLQPGERFPINDPHLLPQLDPRPDSDVEFLKGLLTGMAQIEAKGYNLLHRLGAPPLRRVFTSGGGARNGAWTTIRYQLIKQPIQPADHTEAAVGAAYLAGWGMP